MSENDFLTKIRPDDSIQSVLSYPHPFARGGLIVVFKDRGQDWLAKLSRAEQARMQVDPKLQLHCVTTANLFELSQPGMFTPPLQVNPYPHLPYWLRHKGACLWGEDIREQVLPYPFPDHLLAGHIEGCFDYLRRYGILMSLMAGKHVELGLTLLREMQHLFGTALLLSQVWDVSYDTVAEQFAAIYPNHNSQELYRQSQKIQPHIEAASTEAIHQLVHHFERFLRSMRYDDLNR